MRAKCSPCWPARRFVGLQRPWLGRADELLSLGLPDWRGPALTVALGTLFERRAGELSVQQREALSAFVGGLPARFAAIAACGMADGLVHGDFHPGNVRGSARSLSLLDWADSGIGHPMLDRSAFLSRMPAAGVASAQRHWTEAWQRLVAGADVERAAGLLAPIACARQALVYQRFLDQIEDTEQPYHRADVLAWLVRATEQLQSDDAG